jgi:hypothetical protein
MKKETEKLLETLVKLAYDHAKNVIIKHKSQLAPTWLMINEKAEVYVMCTPWGDDREKMFTELIVRAGLLKYQAIAYSIVAEAWMASYKETDEIRIRENPNREEVVMAFTTDGKDKIFRAWKLKRNHLEQVTDLEKVDPQQLDEEKAESWMLNLFEE